MLLSLSLSLSLATCLPPASPAGAQKPAPGKRAAAKEPKEPTAPAEPPSVEQGELLLHLPFEAGKSFACQRAPGQESPGEGADVRWAADFALPRGTPVVASADGWVVEVEHDWDLTGDREALEPFANRVTLDHGEGRFTRYLHLAPRSAVVEEGAYVRTGQRLAQSGESGRTRGPKLRFLLGDVWGRAAPLRFVDLKEGVPGEGLLCHSKNEAPGKAKPAKKSGGRMMSAEERAREKEREQAAAAAEPQTPLSSLSGDAFLFNRVELTSTLPANVFEHDWTYVLTGRVTDDSKRVVLFLSRRNSDSGSVGFFAGDVNSQKSWSMTVTLSDLGEKLDHGRFRYALTTVGLDGTYRSAKLLPMVITRK